MSLNLFYKNTLSNLNIIVILVSIILVVGVILYMCVMCRDSITLSIKNKKRIKELEQTDLAEEYYYDVIKHKSNLFSRSQIFKDPSFMHQIQMIKKYLKENNLEKITDEKISSLLSTIKNYEDALVAQKSSSEVLDIYSEVKDGYLKEYYFYASQHINKLLPVLSYQKELSTSIETLREIIGNRHFTKKEASIKLLLLQQISEIETILSLMISEDTVKALEHHQIMSRVADIEAYLSFIEIFRTLPQMPLGSSKEFKLRVFKLHMESSLSQFGDVFSILYGDRISLEVLENRI
ncbi:hypothetical protein NEOKW01_0036 [Nematocida sp. AWRm80]|nr:hypothetical protein NEOKW01_0036 [Nematocida sp. AWRm80]